MYKNDTIVNIVTANNKAKVYSPIQRQHTHTHTHPHTHTQTHTDTHTHTHTHTHIHETTLVVAELGRVENILSVFFTQTYTQKGSFMLHKESLKNWNAGIGT